MQVLVYCFQIAKTDFSGASCYHLPLFLISFSLSFGTRRAIKHIKRRRAISNIPLICVQRNIMGTMTTTYQFYQAINWLRTPT